MKKLKCDKLIEVFIVILLGIGMQLKIFSVISNEELMIISFVIGILYIIFLIVFKAKSKKINNNKR